jgi:hypothetical protein
LGLPATGSQERCQAHWKYYEDFDDHQSQETDDINRQRKQRLRQWYLKRAVRAGSSDLAILEHPWTLPGT